MAADSPAERAHWRSVLKAYDGYMQYHLSANHARRMAFLALPKDSREVYDQLGYRDKLDAVDEGIRRNAEFIDQMIADPVFSEMLHDPEPSNEGPSAITQSSDNDVNDNHTSSTSDPSHSHSHAHSDPSHSHSHSHSSAPSSSASPDGPGSRHAAQDKVRSTLRSFVRDWSAEGAPERDACYARCLATLQQHWAHKIVGKPGRRAKGDWRVLVPGCGLGRLAMEIAALGFESQGNEFSTYMLLASNWVLNQTDQANAFAIHPYLHSFSNHLSTANLLRAVPIPDVSPRDVLANGEGGGFSLVAGDFEEIYGVALDEEDGDEVEGRTRQRGKWGAVVTCFFIDCARNVLRFLRIIHALLEDDGIWVNIGPLLWHFENAPTSGKNGEGSIELSLDEVKELAFMVGFEIAEHADHMVRSTYTGIPGSMLRHEYNAAFWTATKINLEDD